MTATTRACSLSVSTVTTMKGDRWVCPKCRDTIEEGDVPYIAATCNATVKCRHQGGTIMRKEVNDGDRQQP